MKILNKLSAALKNTNAKKNDDNDTYTPILAEEDYPFKSDVEVIEMPKSAIKPVETKKNAEIHIIQFTENKPVEVQRVSLNKEQAYKMGWHYKRKSNNCLRITRYTGKSQDITLPAEIDGFIVNEIGKEVFNRKNIITVAFIFLAAVSCIIAPKTCKVFIINLHFLTGHICHFRITGTVDHNLRNHAKRTFAVIDDGSTDNTYNIGSYHCLCYLYK